MKRTFTINISGIVFHIDDDAYEVLQEYLNALKRSFSNIDEGNEVMADIEARIVELFHERLINNREVVTVKDVDEVIVILGKPEEFEDNAGDEQFTQDAESENSRTSEGTKHGRRMYRDLDNAVLGGVSAGMAAFFGIDPIVVRVLFIVSLFFVGPLLYIILWIAIPAARSSAQKIEMRGERVNIENIERQVRNEYENVKNNFRNYKKKEGGRIEDVVNEIINVFALIARPVGKILLFVAAIFIFVFVISILVKILGNVWIGDFYLTEFFRKVNDLPFPSFLGLIINSDYINLVIYGLLIILLVPVLGIILGIVKGIMGWKRSPLLGGIMSSLLIVGLSLLIYVGIIESTHFKGNGMIKEKYALEIPQSNVLHINVPNNPYAECTENEDSDFDENCGHYYDWKNYAIINQDFSIIANEGNLKLSVVPKVIIKRNQRDSIEVLIKKYSLGDDMHNAKDNARNLHYDWEMIGDSLNLAAYFTLGDQEKWRNQNVEMIIYIPEKVHVKINENAEYFVARRDYQ